jgi:hypothetical protein
VGGPGSTRWGHRRIPPRRRIGDVWQLDNRQAVRSLLLGRRTNLGEIRWSPRPQRSRSGYLVREGTLSPHRALRTTRDRYTVFVVAWPLPFDSLRLSRFWLVCCGCAKRRKALFLWRGSRLRCRVCLGLAYETQRLTPRKRAAYRRDKIAKRIADYWDSGRDPPSRPKGAHRKRYRRLLTRWHAANDRGAALRG